MMIDGYQGPHLFFASLHGCIFMSSAPASVSRYSESSSEHPLEAKLREVLDAQIALKETVDKAVVSPNVAPISILKNSKA